MDYMCVLLSLFLISSTVDSNTCRSTNGVLVFGDSCDFMCHCKNNEQCDRTSGECSSGCAKGWFGPGCQYRDLAADGSFSQDASSAKLANDDDPETCYESSGTEIPVWEISFTAKETITEIHILTKSNKLQYFRNFKVFVEKKSKHKISSKKCYQHGNDVLKSERFTVLCSSPLVGNQLRIELSEMQTPLVLCDVKINGGRNLAFKQIAYQSKIHRDCYPTCNAEKAVDGRFNVTWNQCSYIPGQKNFWWEVDLGILAKIHAIDVVSKNGEIDSSYEFRISKNREFSQMRTSNKTLVNITGRFIKVTRKHNRRIHICEIYVYGDCQDDMCGYDCKKPCRCRDSTIKDKISGNCNNECKDKSGDYHCNIFYDVKTTTGCESGRFGTDCLKYCSKNCKGDQHGPCNYLDGKCFGGCIDGWEGNMCDQACEGGFFGKKCEGTCSLHCEGGITKCNHTNGHCKDGCKPGWIEPRCMKPCDAGFYGRNCEEKCTEHCAGGSRNCNTTTGYCEMGCQPGWIGLRCVNACDAGFYGRNCEEKCTEHCEGGNRNCNATTGYCEMGCQPGWIGLRCVNECLGEKYGIGCKKNCPLNCKSGVCNHVNGNCSEGCNRGYQGNKCEEECNTGQYGDNCDDKCSVHCKEGGRICRHTDGECLNGCVAGWNGKKCDSQCGPGKFGSGCKESCPSNCKHDVCGYANGNCDEGCKLGFQGEKCKENCTSGTFGDNCNTKCSDYCEGGDKMCRPTDGHCLNGCKAGWNRTDCFSKCDIGFYGKNCALVCGNCQLGNPCDHVTGICHGGCKTGYNGDTCLHAMQTSNISNSIVAGGVAVLLILILIGVIALVWHKQRNQNKRKDEQREDVELRDAVATASNESRRPSHDGNTQSNTADDSGSAAAAGDANIYNNFPMQSSSRNAIPLSNLLPYVKENLANPDHFATEFQEIPYGMKKSSAVAKKSFNRGKNRYKDMHAYDETRVKLKKLPNIQGSDYINASFIKGHHKEYAYIAAQGPIDSSMDDFWRMIWEKDVYTIAMVTNLVELEKTKCQQYWPAVETSTRYGNVFVNTASEIIYYDFTIRNFNVSFEGEPQRNIRQFHFTSWPDKSVPKRPSSLIQFWRNVRKNDENKDHTWLVHCSAGVGRTGTFIALDILYDQGKDKGFIDVYQCVKELRDQRVNMVQTKEQYVYLHGLMVGALLLFSEPVPLDNIHKAVRDLKTVDQATKKTKMLLQYEALKKDMTLLRTEKEVKEMYSTALLKENSSKNRSINVLPPNDFRPFLITNIPGCTNYINAVLTPSYCHSHGCYVTQKPLENTAVDFCRLLYEMNVKVIVKFPDNEKNHVEPDMSIGPFTLKKVSEEDKVFYTMTVFNMAYNSKNKKITQLEFKNWNTDQITPTGPENMLHFLQEVERLNRIAADSPLLVQCLDGSEKSGLFITLMNIFDRVRLDKEVCIPQVIRELRYIRQQFIPNFEQFQFCYNAVLCYVDSHQMYANM